MKGVLNENRIKYVLFHLKNEYDIPEIIEDKFIFSNDFNQLKNSTGKIAFLLSNKELDVNSVININNIPILFPSELNKPVLFSTINNNGIIFNHDLLKSAFYLLSGFQELTPDYKDHFNRFPYELSLQKKLGITQKPIVNYYFERIAEGINAYCKMHNIVPVERKNKNFRFFLTHDIDRIDTYKFYKLLYYYKVLFGFTKKDWPFSIRLKKAWEYTFNFLFTNKNPYWDFDFHIQLEKKYNLKPSYYFLAKDLKHHDAYYSFDDKRLQKLYAELKENNFEIGIHGTNRSATSLNKLKRIKNELSNHTNTKVIGIRQHRLIFDMNITPFLHEQVGLVYDTTLGFAEHEGFRNSYCLPFKLYNFKEERSFNTWEIPLNIMDATLLEYRKLDMQDAFLNTQKLIDEIRKFNGVFTLLWHNGYFDETIHPGIDSLYKNILDYVVSLNPKNLDVRNIINYQADSV